MTHQINFKDYNGTKSSFRLREGFHQTQLCLMTSIISPVISLLFLLNEKMVSLILFFFRKHGKNNNNLYDPFSMVNYYLNM